MLPARHLLDTPCPIGYRTVWPLRSWLSPVTRSAGSEPNQAGLVGLRQSPGSSRFERLHRNRGPSLHRHYPASSLLHPHPSSAVGGSILRRTAVARLPAGRHRGLPLLHDRSIAMRAATTTPVDAARALFAHSRTANGLPRYYGESASTTAFRGLLGVHSRCGPHSLLASNRGLFKKCFSPFVTSWTAPCASGRSESWPGRIFTDGSLVPLQGTHTNPTERSDEHASRSRVEINGRPVPIESLGTAVAQIPCGIEPETEPAVRGTLSVDYDPRAAVSGATSLHHGNGLA